MKEKELCAYLNVDKRQVALWVKQGLPCEWLFNPKSKSSYRNFDLENVIKWLQSNREGV